MSFYWKWPDTSRSYSLVFVNGQLMLNLPGGVLSKCTKFYNSSVKLALFLDRRSKLACVGWSATVIRKMFIYRKWQDTPRSYSLVFVNGQLMLNLPGGVLSKCTQFCNSSVKLALFRHRRSKLASLVYHAMIYDRLAILLAFSSSSAISIITGQNYPLLEKSNFQTGTASACSNKSEREARCHLCTDVYSTWRGWSNRCLFPLARTVFAESFSCGLLNVWGDFPLASFCKMVKLNVRLGTNTWREIKNLHLSQKVSYSVPSGHSY